MNSKPVTHKIQGGFSLIEIMIALIIGFILTAGAAQIFISSKATYRLESALSRMQETGRFIVDVLSQEIRMGGFNGCASRANITPNVIAKAPPPIQIIPDNGVNGSNATGTNTWAPALLPHLAGVISDTDVITINRADECGAAVAGNYDPTNANVQVAWPNGCGFQQNQPVLITDCSGADIYQISNTVSGTGNVQTTAHGTGANTTNNVSKTYGPDAQVFKFLSNSFYIAPGASGEPALWQSAWTPNSDTNITAADFTTLELADGVEDMQVLYGIDNGGGDEFADNYIVADGTINWIDVRSVRISLLLRSADRITDAPRSIMFNGAAVNAGAGADRRLRTVYTTTISLRNRLP